MIPSSVTTAVSGLAAMVASVAPLESAQPLQIETVQAQGAVVMSTIANALTGAAGELDAGDPAGYVGDLPGDLVALRDASQTQSDLCDVTAYVGRAVFNMNQITP